MSFLLLVKDPESGNGFGADEGAAGLAVALYLVALDITKTIMTWIAKANLS